MKLIVEISCDNAAFGEPESAEFGEECERILRVVGEKIADGHAAGPCVDYNGNRVGSFYLQGETE